MKKLQLKKTTIARLDQDELSIVKGGITRETRNENCIETLGKDCGYPSVYCSGSMNC
ncbi:MAG: class I lanthipeptide [Hyphomicrobiales bacterium]